MKPQPEEGKASVKNIKDYLHLYLGCEGRVSIDYGFPMRGMKIVDCVLIGIVGEIVTLECYDINGNKWESEHICHYGRFKPNLRSLSDIKMKDAHIVADKLNIITDNVMLWINGVTSVGGCRFKTSVALVNELRKLCFDCDELIESGLAIDKTKLTTHV